VGSVARDKHARVPTGARGKMRKIPFSLFKEATAKHSTCQSPSIYTVTPNCLPLQCTAAPTPPCRSTPLPTSPRKMTTSPLCGSTSTKQPSSMLPPDPSSKRFTPLFDKVDAQSKKVSCSRFKKEKNIQKAYPKILASMSIGTPYGVVGSGCRWWHYLLAV